MKQKKTILIVDDSILIVERLIDILKSMDIGPIKHAGTYEEATTLIAQYQPDIIFLDINLPGKSGIELLKKIKQDEQKSIIIMFTNYANDYYKTLCMKLGANYFVDKSIDFELIPEIISSID